MFVRNPERSFTVPLVAQVLIYAGVYARQLQGVLAVADISGPTPGPFPPHKSHQEGFDADVAYDLSGTYSTPIDSPITPNWIGLIHAIAPMLEQIFMSNARIEEFKATAPKAPIAALAPITLTFWAGHQEHAHLRFRTGKINLLPGPTKPP